MREDWAGKGTSLSEVRAWGCERNLVHLEPKWEIMQDEDCVDRGSQGMVLRIYLGTFKIKPFETF